MGERGREGQRVRKSQRAVTRSKLRSFSSDRAVDIDHVRADRCEELIDLRVRAVLQRPEDDFRVHGCRDQNSIAARKMRSENLDCSLVLRVRRVKERDHDIGVERYSPHSPRRPLR